MPSPSFAAFYLTGPTASGKSALAVALARRVGGEVVNADAFQLYAGLDLLTAKPTPSEMAEVPHHLYGVLPLEEACDAQRYRDLAFPVIREIASRGKVPVVVGGSGLYIKALTHGLATLPPVDEALRASLREMSMESKVARLLELDPEASSNVPLANPRYVERALEICLLTGQPQSALRQTFQHTPEGLRGVFLDWRRDLLYERIDRRTKAMFAAGLLEEVSALPHLGLTAEKAIGVREVRAHLSGEMTLDEALAAIQQATRRYAKRQLTWFRRERWLQTICLETETAAESVLSQISTLQPCLPTTPPPPPSPSL